MDGGKIDVNITFDENNQIRVLSSEKYRETENLKSECIDFLKSKYHQLPQASTKNIFFKEIDLRNRGGFTDIFIGRGRGGESGWN